MALGPYWTAKSTADQQGPYTDTEAQDAYQLEGISVPIAVGARGGTLSTTQDVRTPDIAD